MENNNIRKYLIYLLLVIIVGLLGYLVYFIVSNSKDNDLFETNLDSVTPSTNLIDKYEQPNPNVKVTKDTLPESTDTITLIDYKTFKELFEIKKRSILVIARTDCHYCNEFEPILADALNIINKNAYRINVDSLKSNEKISSYVEYKGTPTTCIIENGKVTHTFTGSTDKETILAFLDLYFLRK